MLIGTVMKTIHEEEYNIFIKNIQKEREDTNRFVKILFAIVIAICLAAIVVLFFAEKESVVEGIFGADSEITKKLAVYSESQENRKPAPTLSLMPRRQNILLLGVDTNIDGIDAWRGTRSDTMILVNIDSKSKTVNALTIPRDCKVILPGNHGIQKINSAHAIGGIDMVKKTIREMLGVKVDKYIIINDETVKQFVDALGGVPIYVEKRMYYHDYSAKLHIDLQKGEQVLNGTQAVGYLRYRKDGLGDIGRGHRQQWFLKHLMKKLKSPATIAKLPELINVFHENVKTDMSIFELTQLANYVRGVDENHLEIALLPGAPNQKGYISYWIIDPVKTQEVINRLIYRDVDPSDYADLTAGLMFETKRAEDAKIIKAGLEEMGYKVNTMELEYLPHTQFVANSNKVSTEFFDYVRKKLPQIRNCEYIFDPSRNYSVNSDFTIVLGEK